jgi:peptide/nickel transport system substrate-binding protein
MRRTKWSAVALLFSGALVLAACGQQGASPSASADDQEPAGTPGAEESAPAAGNFEDTIVMALDAQVGQMSNAASDVPTARITALIYDTLYVLDDTLTPVPLLAADLCDVSEDEITWTCTIRDDATFHNGEPITADDVAYSFQLAVSPNCTYNPSICLTDFVESVEATDETTVVFTLLEPYAPFATVNLASTTIESRAVIEAAYEEYAGATEGLAAEDVNAVVEGLTAATEAEEPDPAACETVRLG